MDSTENVPTYQYRFLDGFDEDEKKRILFCLSTVSLPEGYASFNGPSLKEALENTTRMYVSLMNTVFEKIEEMKGSPSPTLPLKMREEVFPLLVALQTRWSLFSDDQRVDLIVDGSGDVEGVVAVRDVKQGEVLTTYPVHYLLFEGEGGTGAYVLTKQNDTAVPKKPNFIHSKAVQSHIPGVLIYADPCFYHPCFCGHKARGASSTSPNSFFSPLLSGVYISLVSKREIKKGEEILV